jgi:hypothetical protein
MIVRRPDFPAPVGREGQSRLWDRREVVEEVAAREAVALDRRCATSSMST